ncbi:MAG TPA: pyruvate, water dikinase regulatory protein [Stellaceae bacterium]|nr:pyruvate, water dikinase regulatory protein [Stellaceae bacterium]
MTETRFHLHLVSDSTGETVHSVARACLVQFDEAEAVEHIWSMVRTKMQMERVIHGIKANPGVVLFTLVDEGLRGVLQEGCRKLQVPAIPVLDPVLAVLASQLGRKSRGLPGQQHLLDTEYFRRIDAMSYTLAHDDGQSAWGLNDADVVLVGVSRTSKTPTCMYLANRGIKAANVPIVPGTPLPEELLALARPLVVGLTNDPERLVQVRRNRLQQLHQEQARPMEYTDSAAVREEVQQARRLFTERHWPVIDVTRRSIEETAAAILRLLAQRQGQDA